ncbi:type I methionyl aminopeptidase [Salinibacterium sp. G-O1]|uniref:type I methionyl aminopeptidase n=1 Tax=Salinibacterium sp. G-O1 TaxID=3046208 RepID=UPI0024BB0397|nr:type I methionyl aminopeptidase [Salinibacterium sp. G-O1]MDJ0334168.1 type I methionyl aminopeptidase [Salinibacterium sp. G-O1]
MAFGNRKLYKTPAELRLMVEPGILTAAALAAVRLAIAPGVTTLQLDAIAERVIRAGGGVPNFMKEPGYRHTICASVNDEIVHGVPGDRVIAAGDLVSIDCGAEVGGWNGDAAFSVVVPDPSRPEVVAQRQQLSDATERSLWAGIAALATARKLNDVGGAIEDSLQGDIEYGIVEDFTGHGIGRSMHEDPPVFNYRVRGSSPEIKPGLVVAIEPMVTMGGIDSHVLADDWTIATNDGLDAAHWEHSIAVHAGGIWVLTAEDGGADKLGPHGVIPVPVA